MNADELDWDYGGKDRGPKKPFEAKMLPEGQRIALCEQLLSTFGVSKWRTNNKGEMIHSCPIPGRHLNGDRNPSASLSYKELAFHCYGCGSSGGLLWFIATCQRISTAEARKWLEGQTGLGGQVMELEALLAFLDGLYAKPESRPIPRYAPETLDPWLSWNIPHPYLTDPVSEGGRGIPAQTCWDFSVGYAPEYELYLGSKTPIHQERVVIPLWWRGNLVGWQARALDPADDPKYHNSPDFPRDVAIYNYDRTRRTCVLVESPMSVLRHHHHVPELMSTYGASVSEAQIKHLRKFDRVVVWFDNDEAGWNATDQLTEELSTHTDLAVVSSDLDADPADLDDDPVDELIRSAVPWSLWRPPKRLRPKEAA